MRDYHKDIDTSTPQWIPMFLSLMLVLITLFVFLTTFAEGDILKTEEFRRFFKESMMMPEKVETGKEEEGGYVSTESNPLKALVNRMKSKGINGKLMVDFLTPNPLDGIDIKDGRDGVVVTLPEIVSFATGKAILSRRARIYLTKIAYLASILHYLVEIKGYTSPDFPTHMTDALELSCQRAIVVYNYLVMRKVNPAKLKITGHGDAFAESGVRQDKVEILFKEIDL